MIELVEVPANLSGMTMNDRVKEACESAGLTQADLARVIGATPGTAYFLMRGPTAKLRGDYALALESATGYSHTWLMTGKGPKKRMGNQPISTTLSTVLEKSATVKIPVVRFNLTPGSAGFKFDVLNEEPEFVVMQDWLEKSGYKQDKLHAVRITGQAMEPVLYDGDLIIINTDDSIPADGQVYAFNYDGQLLVARAFHIEGKWSLRSDNQDKRRYPDRPAHSGVSALGRVVLRQSSIL